MFFLIYILCAPLILDAGRLFNDNETHALDTLFGVKSSKELKVIEEKPEEFWEKRKKYLEENTISHFEFCTIYTEKFKTKIQKKMEEPETKTWFKGLSDIDEVVESVLDKGHPLFTDVKLYVYACLCDYIHNPDSALLSKWETRKVTLKKVRLLYGLCKTGGESLNKKKRWLVIPGGMFSIFDSMVALHNNQYLCGISDNVEDLFEFKTHYQNFFWCFGAVHHDNTHAYWQELHHTELAKVGVSSWEYFNACYSPKTLVKGNIVELAKQTLGTFVNFHEECAQWGALIPGDKKALLCPKAQGLGDGGFLELVPCFCSHTPSKHEWETTPLPFVRKSAKATHQILLSWRDQYCREAAKKFL